MSENLERWKRAVVHIESASSSVGPLAIDARSREVWEEVKAGAIGLQEYIERTRHPYGDLRFLGTALFVAEGEREFLVTARHVVHDGIAAEDYRKEAAARGQSERAAEFTEHFARRRIRPVLCRVPSLSEVTHDPDRMPEFLTAVGAGSEDEADYSFSDPDLDLAVVSLAPPFQHRLAADLRRAGHVPVGLGDFADEPSAEGVPVFTAGYPTSLAILSRREFGEAEMFRSSFVSLPGFGFGRVSMLHPSLEYFWADLPAYAGNSGGPVVGGDRLVGLVSTQAATSDPIIHDGKELTITVTTSLPFARATKAKHVRALIERQIETDRYREEARRRRGSASLNERS